MTAMFRHALRRFRRDKDGTASIEFVIVVPVFLALMMMSIEIGFITMRNTMLERGLDIAVREIRLGTGNAPQHDAIKKIVCDNSVVIYDCMNTLRLEMRPTDIRAFNALNTEADCTDAAEPTKPLRTFTPGGQNELMLLRVCVKYKPLFPKQFLGAALQKDVNGQAAIISMAAFVQEPI
ncbi:MAG: TadE/TadG family type IV pilus assembly protein [Roseovarius sp.]|nr:TadE/TadG family type IV pilus assembly protein [Roseovarius sp.]